MSSVVPALTAVIVGRCVAGLSATQCAAEVDEMRSACSTSPRTTSRSLNDSQMSSDGRIIRRISEATRATVSTVIDRFDFTNEYSPRSVESTAAAVTSFLRLRRRRRYQLMCTPAATS